jgi:Protein of unknown function (DUF2934)
MKSGTMTATVEGEKHVTIEPKQSHRRHVVAPTIEEIRERAFEIYIERGGFDGADQDDWFQAERELANRSQPS